jgi:hypothetical protein
MAKLALRVGRALYFQEDSWYSFLLEAESTPGPQYSWIIKTEKKKAIISSGIEPTTFWL